MPVLCECINVFVKFDSLATAFPSLRWSNYPVEAGLSPLWHDGEVVRLGAMNDLDIQLIIAKLKRSGLKPLKDFGGFDVEWLEVDWEGEGGVTVSLKGGAAVVTVGAHNFEDFVREHLRPH